MQQERNLGQCLEHLSMTWATRWSGWNSIPNDSWAKSDRRNQTQAIQYGRKILQRISFIGMKVENFSAGANLAIAIHVCWDQEYDWNQYDLIGSIRITMMRARFSICVSIVAPQQYGLLEAVSELSLHSDHIQAHWADCIWIGRSGVGW